MEYKGLFNKIVLLISSPAKAWNEISEEANTRHVMENFVYPLIGLCGLSVFIGCFIGNTAGANEAFQVAMKRCCATCVSLFGGFFLASYLSDLLGKKLLGRESEMEQNRCFIGYSMNMAQNTQHFVLCYVCAPASRIMRNKFLLSIIINSIP